MRESYYNKTNHKIPESLKYQMERFNTLGSRRDLTVDGKK